MGTTTALIFGIPKVTGRFIPQYKSFFPGTLIAIILVTGFVLICGGLGIQSEDWRSNHKLCTGWSFVHRKHTN